MDYPNIWNCLYETASTYAYVMPWSSLRTVTKPLTSARVNKHLFIDIIIHSKGLYRNTAKFSVCKLRLATALISQWACVFNVSLDLLLNERMIEMKQEEPYNTQTCKLKICSYAAWRIENVFHCRKMNWKPIERVPCQPTKLHNNILSICSLGTIFVPNELCKWLRPLERNFILNQCQWLSAVTRCLRSLKSNRNKTKTTEKVFVLKIWWRNWSEVCKTKQKIMTQRPAGNVTKFEPKKGCLFHFQPDREPTSSLIMVRCYTIFFICFDIIRHEYIHRYVEDDSI